MVRNDMGEDHPAQFAMSNIGVVSVTGNTINDNEKEIEKLPWYLVNSGNCSGRGYVGVIMYKVTVSS